MALASTIALALLALTSLSAAASREVAASGSRGARAAPAATHRDPAADTPQAVTAEDEGPRLTRISAAILRAEGFERAGLERAIQVRLPALTLIAAAEDAPPAVDGSLRAFIELRRVSPTQVQLTLILADGRAWLRELEVDADAPARPAASALANLIAGIEDDTLVPDKKDVPIPPALVAPAPTAPAEPVPAVVCPEPPVEPLPPPPPAPRWELGPMLRGGATLGLTGFAGLRGAGLGLGLDARAPAGLLLAVDLQGTTRVVERFQVQRLRVAVGVGYGLRRGSFELPVAVMLGVEPWRLVNDSGAVKIDSRAGAPGPLLAVGLRLSPGFVAPLGRGGARLRAGVRAELWASGEPAGGLRRPEIRLPAGGATSLGGVELHLGLELGVWFPVGKPPRRPARPRP